MGSRLGLFRGKRTPIRRHLVGAAFGRLEDRLLMAASLTATLQGGTLDIEGTKGPDTITVRLYNGYYSIDGLSNTFAATAVQSIKINALGGNDRINLHTAGPLTTANKAAYVTPVNGQLPEYLPITVPTEIHGGDGNDTIDGGEGPDVIFGEAGDDTIHGWGGNDYIDGGIGDDKLYGDDGRDTIYGDLGNDTIDGGAGFDTIYGGAEANTIVDSPKNNSIAGADFIQTIVYDPAIRQEARYLDSDGVLSRNDVLDLFGIANAQATISYTDLSDLQRIEDVGAFLGMPDSVRVLTNKVINYDPANKQFEGSPLEADGRVHAGDSRETVGLLIGKWFYGDDHPLAKSDDGKTTFNYAPVSGTLFHDVTQTYTITGPGGKPMTVFTEIQEPLYTDVVQGNVDDCYYLAGLAGEARTNPQAIRDMFTDNGDGTYTVRLFLNGKADYVTVDNQLPVNSAGKLVFADAGARATDPTNVLWVALAEKAYVEFNASGTIGQDGTNSYQGIDFGYSDVALTQITGVAASRHNFGDAGAAENYLIDDLNAGKVVIWSTKDNPSDTDVVGNHVYVVTGYDPTTNTFQLYNPWGSNGGNYNGHQVPGTLSLTWQQLQANGTGWFNSGG